MKRLIFLFVFINILCLQGYGQSPNVDTLGPGVDTTFYVRDTLYFKIGYPFSGDTVRIVGGHVDDTDSLGGYSAGSYVRKSFVGDSITIHLKDSLYANLIYNLRDSINIAIAESLVNHYKKADVRSLVSDSIQTTLKLDTFGDSIIVHLKDSLYASNITYLRDSINIAIAESLVYHYKKTDIRAVISDSIQTKDAITEISGALDSLSTKSTITQLNTKISTTTAAESLATKISRDAFDDSLAAYITKGLSNDSLQLYFPFDNDAKDYASYKGYNDGTITGAVYKIQSDSFHNGIASIGFNSDGDYISLSAMNPCRTYSLSTWLKLTDVKVPPYSADRFLFITHYGYNDAMIVYLTNANYIAVKHNSTAYYSSFKVLSTDGWVQIGITYNYESGVDSTLTFYKNGIAVNSCSAITPAQTSDNWGAPLIGAFSSTTSSWIGQIDEFKFWSGKSLTAKEENNEYFHSDIYNLITMKVTAQQLSDSIQTVTGSNYDSVNALISDSIQTVSGADYDSINALISDSIQTINEITEISGALDSLATKATVTQLNLKATTTVMVESLATKATVTQLNLKATTTVMVESLATKATITQLNAKLGVSAASDTFLRKSQLGDSTYNKAKILSIVTDSIKTVKNAVDIWFDAMLFVPDSMFSTFSYKVNISYFIDTLYNYYSGWQLKADADSQNVQYYQLWKTIEIPNDFISWDIDSAFTIYFYPSSISETDSSLFKWGIFNANTKVGGGFNYGLYYPNADIWYQLPVSKIDLEYPFSIKLKAKDFIVFKLRFSGRNSGFVNFRGIRMRYNRK